MSPSVSTSAPGAKSNPPAADWRGTLMAALVGAGGGSLGAWLAMGSPVTYSVAGCIFGLVGAAGLRGRTENAGAGLRWMAHRATG